MCRHLAVELDPMYRGAMPMIGPHHEKVPDKLEDEPALLPAQERRRLWDFLHSFDGVTQKQKHAIIRRLVDEATFKDIGVELGIAPENAFKLYKRALKRIEKAWQQYE